MWARTTRLWGSDILSILGAVAFPERVLGAEAVAKPKAIESKGWSPIADFLEPLAVVEAQVGPFGLVSLGRELFRLSHEAAIKATGRTAADVIYGIDRMYRHGNRGREIGGWRVLSFEPGTAMLEKTTPHPCKLEEGILAQALMTLGVPSIVEQRNLLQARRGRLRVHGDLLGDP